MGDVGTCCDNAVVERFFGSLKHDWLFKVHHPTRKHMKSDVAAYMKYYQSERLHSANSNETPVRLEQLFYRGVQNDERLAGESCIGVGSQQAKRVSYVKINRVNSQILVSSFT